MCDSAHATYGCFASALLLVILGAKPCPCIWGGNTVPRRNRRRGFTLVELLIVIILGVLAGTMLLVIGKARETRIESNMGTIQKAAMMYCCDNGESFTDSASDSDPTKKKMGVPSFCLIYRANWPSNFPMSHSVFWVSGRIRRRQQVLCHL